MASAGSLDGKADRQDESTVDEAEAKLKELRLAGDDA
jgi:hypothetical protein